MDEGGGGKETENRTGNLGQHSLLDNWTFFFFKCKTFITTGYLDKHLDLSPLCYKFNLFSYLSSLLLGNPTPHLPTRKKGTCPSFAAVDALRLLPFQILNAIDCPPLSRCCVGALSSSPSCKEEGAAVDVCNNFLSDGRK